MQNKLNEALEHISDRHIAEAAKVKKARRPYWLGAVAAALAVAVLAGFMLPEKQPPTPTKIPAQANPGASLGRFDPVQEPSLPPVLQDPPQEAIGDPNIICLRSEPRITLRPDFHYNWDPESLNNAWDAWRADFQARNAVSRSAMDTLQPFFAATTQAYLAGDENRVWSPVNAYIALGMLAEVTDGETRAQILDVLGESDLSALRSHVSALWESVYCNDGNEIATLANSLWLQEGLQYNQETMAALAYYHYASAFREDLASPEANRNLQAWLNQNTGGLLEDYANQVEFPEEAVLTLASTICLQSKWMQEFSPERNTQAIFHSPGADREVTFMNQNSQSHYWWGSNYGAICLPMENETQLWLILPDEGASPKDVLKAGEFWTTLRFPDPDDRCKYLNVNLSMPKFDISSGDDLGPMLQAMGINDVFSPEKADFSAITADVPVFVSQVKQAARFVADEEGVKAASYVVLPAPGAGMPPEEEIDFILDRPFLFVLTAGEGIPLFAGVVNVP